MLASSRLTEKWINRGLWIISFVFAGFLIGLGSLVVQDLPRVQKTPVMEDYVDKNQYAELNKMILQKENTIGDMRNEIEIENQKSDVLNSDYMKFKETFTNWISTRQATKDGTQNKEVVTRTRELEKQQKTIKEQEEKIQLKKDSLKKFEEDLHTSKLQLSKIQDEANEQVEKENRFIQLKVFGYRLALTLPLLLIGIWLVLKKRQTKHWPFIWGFGFFTLYTFFVELVPYLPSYGGYIRYIVGIVLTFFIGQYSIKALQNYLEKQKKTEAQPSSVLKEKMDYDLTNQKFSRGICPGCERQIDLKDPTRNFCIHCGTCLFNSCVKCQARKNAFAKYCHACGEVG